MYCTLSGILQYKIYKDLNTDRIRIESPWVLWTPALVGRLPDENTRKPVIFRVFSGTNDGTPENGKFPIRASHISRDSYGSGMGSLPFSGVPSLGVPDNLTDVRIVTCGTHSRWRCGCFLSDVCETSRAQPILGRIGFGCLGVAFGIVGIFQKWWFLGCFKVEGWYYIFI